MKARTVVCNSVAMVIVPLLIGCGGGGGGDDDDDDDDDNGVILPLPELVDLEIPEHHGISAGANVSIEPGSAHHGQHGVSVACPAGGMTCVVNFTVDGAKYHVPGGTPEVLIHELVWAANDEEGRAESVFSRDQPDNQSGNSPVSYGLHDVMVRVDHTGTDVEFELDYPNPFPSRAEPEDAPKLLDGLRTRNHEVESNIPELAGWTGAALSQSDTMEGLTIHANVYSDIEADEDNVEDADYLVLGVWLEVPDDIVDGNDSRIGVFWRGSDPFVEMNVNGLTGSATYTGPAIGMYEERIAGSDDDIRIGSFVASAELNADFGDSSQPGVITGSITEFRENGQPLGDWSVRLVSNSDISGTRMHGNPEISRDGGATYEGSGEWEAFLYGNGAMSADHPTSVAGWFWSEAGVREMTSVAGLSPAPTTPVAADTGYLGLIGAFGAER